MGIGQTYWGTQKSVEHLDQLVHFLNGDSGKICQKMCIYLGEIITWSGDSAHRIEAQGLSWYEHGL